MLSFGKKFIKCLILGVVFLLGSSFSDAQIDNFSVSAVKGGFVDTLALENAQKVVRESAGILEKEVDPTKYTVGPFDEIVVSILGPKSKQYELTISSEGKVFIPDIGSIDLKNKTLAEADSLIRKKVKLNYKADEVNIFLKEIRKFKVIVGGSALKPAIVSATPMDRVSEVIDKAGGLKPAASLRKILLIRNSGEKVIKVDLLKFFMTGDKESNPYVLGGDYIMIPPSSEQESIQILGEVGFPNKFEFSPDDSLSTIIRLAQGIIQSSFLDSVEIVRFSQDGSNYKKWFVNINHWRDKINSYVPLEGDFPLQPGDRVFIRRIPFWQKKYDVAVTGEVKFPGHYVIDEKTIKLSDILERAGGLTNNASPEKALLVRRTETGIYDREMERLWKLNKNEMSDAEFQYFNAKKNEIPGAMSIDFSKVIADSRSDENVVLIHDDSIHVPAKKLFIGVQGMVNKPGLVVYQPNLTYKDYIELAGGFSYKADKSSTLVLKSKGEQFLAKSMNYKLEPGDNILVPPEQERLFSEALTTVITIITQVVTVLGVVVAILRLN